MLFEITERKIYLLQTHMKKLIQILFLILYLGTFTSCIPAKVVEKGDAFYIKNMSNKPLSFVYEINGDITNTKRTPVIFPKDTYIIDNYLKKIKKIKVVGKVSFKEFR